MSESIHPVVAAEACRKCGARQWRKVGEKTLHGPTKLELYECMNPACPGVKETEHGAERWPLSWAYEA